MAKDLRKLEAKLTREQITAAQLLAVNNFLPKEADEHGRKRLTLDEIAAQANCSISALYKWRHYNDTFIDYVTELSSNAFKSHIPQILEKHLDMTLKGQGSMKGIELFYKFAGLLVDKSEVRTEDASGAQSLDERLARLRERAESVADKTEDDE